jgi:hypothetical protein
LPMIVMLVSPAAIGGSPARSGRVQVELRRP